MAQLKTARQTQVGTRETSKLLQALAAALLGIGLFVGVALSHPAAVHNAAHDSRHGIAVPCH